MSEDIELQLNKRVLSGEIFALQIDESTDEVANYYMKSYKFSWKSCTNISIDHNFNAIKKNLPKVIVCRENSTSFKMCRQHRKWPVIVVANIYSTELQLTMESDPGTLDNFVLVDPYSPGYTIPDCVDLYCEHNVSGTKLKITIDPGYLSSRYAYSLTVYLRKSTWPHTKSDSIEASNDGMRWIARIPNYSKYVHNKKMSIKYYLSRNGQ